MRHIGVLNRSKKVTDEQARLMTEACYRQLRRHAAPAWNKTPYPVFFYPDEDLVPDDADQIVILDTPDLAGALGYHSETPKGRVYGKVFVGPILKSGGTILTGASSVAVTLSHEVLEQFIDPDCNLWADDGSGKMFAVEICDPVEADTYVMKVNGVEISVSNFVFPEWFDRENARDSRFDQMGVLKKPFTMSDGGYYVTRASRGEKETYARRYPGWKKKGKVHPAARTARRKP